MKNWTQIILMVGICVAWTFVGHGCNRPLAMQPVMSEGDQRLMFVPIGTKIGDVVTDANGVYISEDFPGEVFLMPPGTVITPAPEPDWR